MKKTNRKLKLSRSLNMKGQVCCPDCEDLVADVLSPEAANAFLQATNPTGRLRGLDGYRAFLSVARTFGRNLEYAYGTKGGRDFRYARGVEFGTRVKRWLCSGDCDGIRFFERRRREDGSVMLNELPQRRIPFDRLYGCTVVVSGMVESYRFGFAPGLRLDLEDPGCSQAVFSLRRALLCDTDGSSLCGLPDLRSVASEDILAAHDVFASWLDDYKPHDVNKVLFETIAWYEDNNPAVCEVSVALPGEDDLTVIAKRDSTASPWRLSLCRIGEAIPFVCAAEGLGFHCSVDPVQAREDQRTLVRAFCSIEKPEDVIRASDLEHILGDNLYRFDPEFVDEVELSPAGAIDKLVGATLESIAALRMNSKYWHPMLFNQGQEADLRSVGESCKTGLQLMAPVYLTSREKRERHCAAFLSAGISPDGQCVFPTCLTSLMVERNARCYRNALRNGAAERLLGHRG